jgi:hypothetical protein
MHGLVPRGRRHVQVRSSRVAASFSQCFQCPFWRNRLSRIDAKTLWLPTLSVALNPAAAGKRPPSPAIHPSFVTMLEQTHKQARSPTHFLASSCSRDSDRAARTARPAKGALHLHAPPPALPRTLPSDPDAPPRAPHKLHPSPHFVLFLRCTVRNSLALQAAACPASATGSPKRTARRRRLRPQRERG